MATSYKTIVSQPGNWHWHGQHKTPITTRTASPPPHRFPPYHCAFTATPTFYSLLNSWQPLICSPFPWFCHFKNGIYMESYHVEPFVSDIFWQHNSLAFHPGCCMCPWFLPVYCWVIFHLTHVPHFAEPFTRWRRSGFPVFALINKTSTNICLLAFMSILGLNFSWINVQEYNSWVYSRFIFSFSFRFCGFFSIATMCI